MILGDNISLWEEGVVLYKQVINIVKIGGVMQHGTQPETAVRQEDSCLMIKLLLANGFIFV